MPSAPVLAVTWDFGQTLCELDTAMLSRRLLERGIDAPAARLEAGAPAAWATYDEAIQEGHGGHPWKIMMRRLLELGGVAEVLASDAVDWLWTEQPAKNLWRRPIAGMIDVVRDARAAGVKIGIVSNSEGRLAELVEEVGWAADFSVVADSGRLGFEKPDPAIFQHACERLGAPMEAVVHVGDSWSADVQGALGAGLRAVWFRGRGQREIGDGVRRAHDGVTTRAALAELGLRW